MSDLPGYDSWKTTDPRDWELENREEDCTCARSLRSRRNCLIHGIDPDQAYDEWRDREG